MQLHSEGLESYTPLNYSDLTIASQVRLSSDNPQACHRIGAWKVLYLEAQGTYHLLSHCNYGAVVTITALIKEPRSTATR